MKVIFLQDVPRVGRKYDVKEVNDGYAMNFLLPRKFAELATVKSIAALELRQKEIKVEREVRDDLLMKNLEAIKDKVVTLSEKADETGHLFKAVHEKEIVEAMHAQHHAEISEEFLKIEKPIKEVGEHDIPIDIKGKKSSFKLVIERA